MIYASVLAAMEIWDSWPSEWWEWIAIYSHCIVAAHRPTNARAANIPCGRRTSIRTSIPKRTTRSKSVHKGFGCDFDKRFLGLCYFGRALKRQRNSSNGTAPTSRSGPHDLVSDNLRPTTTTPTVYAATRIDNIVRQSNNNHVCRSVGPDPCPIGTWGLQCGRLALLAGSLHIPIGIRTGLIYCFGLTFLEDPSPCLPNTLPFTNRRSPMVAKFAYSYNQARYSWLLLWRKRGWK